MAVFKSKYRELSFYIDGELMSFVNGNFSTDDKRVIVVLENMKDVEKVKEPIKEVVVKQEPKAEEPKKEFKRRPSAK